MLQLFSALYGTCHLYYGWGVTLVPKHIVSAYQKRHYISIHFIREGALTIQDQPQEGVLKL